MPVAGRHLCIMLNGRVRLHLMFMDVVAALQNEALAVDAWFLDGFSPAKNPQIWNQNVYALLAQNSAPAATLATYSAAGAVRRGLAQAGFTVEKRPGHGHKREMIVARLAAPSASTASHCTLVSRQKNTVQNKAGYSHWRRACRSEHGLVADPARLDNNACR